MRTFDVMPEVRCALLRRTRRFENIALYPNFDVISEVNSVLQAGGKLSIRKLSIVSQVKAESIPVHRVRLVDDSCVHHDKYPKFLNDN